jgi:uncharacterized protein YydD (DUF2326 family)
MITRVRANKDSFRSVDFTPGFNVVVADRTKDSTRKDSRNGLGKSTLIEILHFALGGKWEPKGLEGWEFTIGLRLGNRSLDVTRGVSDPKKLVLTGDVAGLGLGKPLTSGVQVSDSDWNEFLGQHMFGLPPKEQAGKWSPSFRSLISYFIRRGKDAFSTPFEHFRKQQEWDKQVSNAFLLGLSWEDAKAWEELRNKDKALESLRAAAKAGVIEGLSGKLGELEAERVRHSDRAKAEASSLQSFRVHPQYRDIEARASQLTSQIHSLSNENIAELNLLSHYRKSLESVVEPAEQDVVQLYEEVGAVLPELVRRRIEEVRDFHIRLVGNRRTFLGEEIERLQAKVRARDEQVRVLTEERAGRLVILREHGALEEYTSLQQSHLATMALIQDLDTRIGNLRKVDAGKSQLKIEREQLFQRARRDYDERAEISHRAIKAFNGHSEALYSEPGILVIQVEHAGFKFEVEIPRAKSAGIGNMKVFCYDLTLAELWARRATTPGLLVHDSFLFDGVDERQIALALQRAAEVSTEKGFQYICTINSDAIPKSEFDSGFDLDQFVRLRLTDATPEGCLLGVRF